MTSDTVDRARSSLLDSLLVVRGLQVLLWLLVASGPVAVVLLAVHVGTLSDRLDIVEARAGFEMPADTSGMEGFAELYVTAYLEAGEETASTLTRFAEDVSLEGMTAGSWLATRTTSLGAEQVGPGYFAVTVAADIAARPESEERSEWLPVGTRFYTVGVVQSDNGWAATGLPTMVASPPRVASPEGPVERLTSLDEAPGLEKTLVHFLTAYLAGDGDLARYTTPDSQVTAPRPTPFTTVEILEAGFVDTGDGARRAGLTVRTSDTEGRVQILDYWLTVSQRDGRWEVSDILPAPPLPSTTD